MSFTASATVTQNIADAIVTDTSIGADATITTRHIFFQRSDGSYLGDTANGTDYWNFPLTAGPTITIPNLLLRDYAMNFSVEWVTATPTPGNTYKFDEPVLFRYYTMTFLYWLTQTKQVVNPAVINKNGYQQNKELLFTLMQEAINAVATAGDIVNAQGCLNEVYNMINSPQQNF